MLMSIFVAVTVPAVVAAAAIGLRRVLGARERSSQGDSTWSSLAIGLAYIAGQAAVARPAFPPVEVTDRIPWLALAATVLAVAEAVWALAPWVRLFGRSLLSTLSLGLMLGPVVSANDLSWPMLGWLTVTAVLAFLAWLNLWALEGLGRGTDAFRGLIVTSSGATLVLLFSGSAVLCLLGVALTVSMAVGRLTAWDRAPVSGLIVGSTVLTALVLEGYIYASMSPWSALLLAAALAGTWITRARRHLDHPHGTTPGEAGNFGHGSRHVRRPRSGWAGGWMGCGLLAV